MIAKDDLLTIFINHTGISDSGLARDLLAGSNWDLMAAERTYKLLQSPGPTKTSASSPITATATQHAAQPSNGLPSASAAGFREPLARADVDGDCRRSRAARHCACRHTPHCAAANRKVIPDQELEEAGATGAAATPVFIMNTHFTFTMPNLSREDPDFAAFVEKDLVDTNMLSSLEAAGRLNWWSPMCEKLIPRITTADGNCLLHSASLCIWGYDDNELYLRKALHRVMAETKKGDWLYRRWRWHQMQQNKQMALVYSEAEWDREWQELLNLASPQPKSVAGKSTKSEYDSCGASTTNGSSDVIRRRSNSMGSHCRTRREVYYKSLEEFHVFVLAHILQRPVIVVADTVHRNPSGDVLQQVPFGGVYLPLGHPPARCHKAPLLIAFDSAHFSALLPESEGSSNDTGPSPRRASPLVPLMDPEGSLLPLHFVVDPGERFDWTGNLDNNTSDMTAEAIVGLLREYLKIEYIEWSGPTGSGTATPSASELELVKCVKKSDGNGKSTLPKLKGRKMSWTLGRKSKKTAAPSAGTVGSALKSKSHSKDSLDESTSDGRRSSADSPADYLLCAKLLVEQPPHYSDRMSDYLVDARRTFDSRRRGAPAPVHSGSSDAFPRSGCSGNGCTRHSSNAQPTTAAMACAHHISDALTAGRYEGVTSPSHVPEVTCPRAVASKPEADRPLHSDRETCGGSGRSLGAAAGVAMDAVAAEAAAGLESGRKCRTNDCEMYGTAAKDNYCSKCYTLAKQKQQQLLYDRASPSPPASPTIGCAPFRAVAPVPRPRLVSRQASIDGVTAGVAAVQLPEGGSQQRRLLGRQSSLYDNLPPSDGSAFTTQLRDDDGNVAGIASRTPPHVGDSLALSSVDGAASLSFTLPSASPPVPQGRASVGRTGAALSLAGDADGGVRVIAARPADDGRFDSDAHKGVASASHGQCRAGEAAGGQPRSRSSAPQLEPPSRSAAAALTWAPKGSISGDGSRSQARPLVSGSPPDAARVASSSSSSRPPPPSSFSTTRPVGNPASLYYAQLRQQQSALSGGGELCRVKGCKQPAKHDGQCQKCYQSSVSAFQYGEKLRRSFRPLPRRANGNFQP